MAAPRTLASIVPTRLSRGDLARLVGRPLGPTTTAGAAMEDGGYHRPALSPDIVRKITDLVVRPPRPPSPVVENADILDAVRFCVSLSALLSSKSDANAVVRDLRADSASRAERRKKCDRVMALFRRGKVKCTRGSDHPKYGEECALPDGNFKCDVARGCYPSWEFTRGESPPTPTPTISESGLEAGDLSVFPLTRDGSGEEGSMSAQGTLGYGGPGRNHPKLKKEVDH